MSRSVRFTCFAASRRRPGDLVVSGGMIPENSGFMSLTKQQALDHFRSDDLIGIGMEADRSAASCIRKAWSATSSIATSTTPISARSTAASALFTAPQGPDARRLRAAEGNDLRQDPGDARPGRHRRADAGRPASGPEDRVVRGPAPAASSSAFRFTCTASPRRK